VGFSGLQGAIVAAIAAVACGRVGFDEASGGADASSSFDGTNPDARPSPACATTYNNALFCEDFETDLTKWFPNVDGANTIVRDTAFARSGSSSAHARAVELGAARLIASALGGASSGTLYIRLYQWVPQAAVIEDVSLIHLVSNMNPYPGMVLALRNEQEFTVLSTINATTGATSVLPMPRGRWACIQGRIEIAANGNVTTRIDGTDAATYVGNTVTLNGYRDFHVGIYVNTGPPIETWVDDVVIDSAPVPCD